jgi:hypothetical protein
MNTNKGLRIHSILEGWTGLKGMMLSVGAYTVAEVNASTPSCPEERLPFPQP